MDFYEKDLKKFEVRKIVMDAEYKTPAIAKMLIDDKIQPVSPAQKEREKKDFIQKTMYMMNIIIVTSALKMRYQNILR